MLGMLGFLFCWIIIRECNYYRLCEYGVWTGEKDKSIVVVAPLWIILDRLIYRRTFLIQNKKVILTDNLFVKQTPQEDMVNIVLCATFIER